MRCQKIPWSEEIMTQIPATGLAEIVTLSTEIMSFLTWISPFAIIDPCPTCPIFRIKSALNQFLPIIRPNLTPIKF